MPRISRSLVCVIVVSASVLSSIDGVQCLKNANAVASINRKRHRRRLPSNNINSAITNNNNNVGRTHSSVHSINRGGDGTKASQKVLQSMRLLYLTYYASMGALLPYLPVYFHSLGHPGSSVGLLGAVKPLTTFLVAPLWGVLSDRSNNHVATLQFTFVSSLIFQLLVGMNSSLNYLIVTVFAAAVLNAPVKSLVDSIVMSKLTSEEDRHQFGRMRLWGQLGFGVGSSLVGSLLSAFPAGTSPEKSTPSAASGSSLRGSIDLAPTVASSMVPSDPTLSNVVHHIEVGIEVASETDAAAETAAVVTKKGVEALSNMMSELLGKTRPLKGYEWAFLTHAVLSVPVFFCIRAFRPEKDAAALDNEKNKKQTNAGGAVEEKKKTDIMGGLRLLSQNKDALIFFFLVVVIGTSSGCVENFAYVRVREVGGTGNNMGMLRLVSSLAGAPMFWFSGPVTEALGTDVVLVLTLLVSIFIFYD